MADLDNDSDLDFVLGNQQGPWVWTNERYPRPASRQANVGFGGPGNVTQTLCGGDLSTGHPATLRISNAPPNAPAFFVAALSSNPVSVPEIGGVLAAFPVAVLLTATTDARGSVTLLVPGGLGPQSIYTQWLVADAQQGAGWAVSNAVKLDSKP